MHIADMTMFYAQASGGVRTYLDAKHRLLEHYPDVRHSLLIPGEHFSERDGIYQVPTAAVPFSQGYRFPMRMTQWRKAIQDLQPDLIEVADPYLTAWVALDARRQLDVPVIGFYHSDLPTLVSNRVGHWLGSNAETYISKLYGHFDRVLTPSSLMAERLIEMGVRNVYVQPLGVDLQTFNPDKRDPTLKRSLGLDDDTRLLVFAGRSAKEKNLPVLIECMKHLGPNYHLLLIGSAMPSQVPDNVSVLGGFRPAEDVARLLASADALVHAGDQETFGLVVLEAMASGIPVVVAGAGAFNEIVPPTCGLLCEPNRPDAMASAVRELFANGSQKRGEVARSYVENHYAWDKVVESLMGHYQDVLGSHVPELIRV